MTAVPWRDAWQAALYGPAGFYSSGAEPAKHFRTSAHASPLFARALFELLHQTGIDAVVDVGAGGGELLRDLNALDPSLTLCGVDVRPRPSALPTAVGWTSEVPKFAGLLLANEWLDNVACPVVELSTDGHRLVLVEPETGEETLGTEPDPLDAKWLERWWPLDQAGQRAEVGRPRDEAWGAAVSRLTQGLAMAIDYAHTGDDRPPCGSLTGFRGGHEVAPVPDGSCDITAHVALDACAAAVLAPALTISQRSALRALGMRAGRPDADLARSDPAAYLSALQAVSDATELTEPRGLGGFTWLVHSIGQPMPAALVEAGDHA